MRFFLASILKFVIFLCKLCQNIKILLKNFLIGPVLGEVRFFRVVLRLCGMKKNFELGGKNIFGFFSFMNPLYDPILVFPKFDPLTASGILGQNVKIYFSLV